MHAAMAPSYTEYGNSTLIAEVIIPLIPLVVSVSCSGYLLGWALE